MRYPFHWPRVPLSQFCFLPEVVTLQWKGRCRFWSYCCLSDRVLAVWSSIKKSVRYCEGLSKSKRPKNSSYECFVSNYTDALTFSKHHFFLHCFHIWELFDCFSKWCYFGPISLWCPKKDFSDCWVKSTKNIQWLPLEVQIRC